MQKILQDQALSRTTLKTVFSYFLPPSYFVRATTTKPSVLSQLTFSKRKASGTLLHPFLLPDFCIFPPSPSLTPNLCINRKLCTTRLPGSTIHINSDMNVNLGCADAICTMLCGIHTGIYESHKSPMLLSLIRLIL